MGRLEPNLRRVWDWYHSVAALVITTPQPQAWRLDGERLSPLFAKSITGVSPNRQKARPTSPSVALALV